MRISHDRSSGIVPSVVGSIVVVGALTRCALLPSVCDLKSTQTIVQRSLIRELMIYKFELGYNPAEETKNIFCLKSEGTVDNSNQRVQEISLWLPEPR